MSWEFNSRQNLQITFYSEEALKLKTTTFTIRDGGLMNHSITKTPFSLENAFFFDKLSTIIHTKTPENADENGG